MFHLAVLIGGFSYSIFFLGLFRLLNPTLIILSALVFLYLLIFIVLRPRIHQIHLSRFPQLSRPSLFLLVLILVHLLVNLVGALGPELGFDALWYHLTLPKMWLSEGFLRFYPGAAYKYSVMPMGTEMLYLAVLAIGNEIWAKLLHFSFGLLVLGVTYRLSRLYLSRFYSLLSVLILISNLVFSWQQTTAYIDLARTFFEVLALYLFLSDRLFSSAVSLGFAVATKLLALSSLPIFLLLSWIKDHNLKKPLVFLLLSLTIMLPWLIRAFILTGNPFYPLFTPLYSDLGFSGNPLDLITIFIRSSDPINPLYLILAPLLPNLFKTQISQKHRLLFLYCLLSLVVWFLTPRTGGGRFILPYLPALSVLASLTISKTQDKFIKSSLIVLTLTLTLTTLVYRTAANSKYFPVLVGLKPRDSFLSSRLNFAAGDYYDTDGFITNTTPPDAKFIAAGVNNLYYFPRAFIPLSALSLGDEPVYLLLRTPDSSLSAVPGTWELIHNNYGNNTSIYRRKETK